jgi:hypothetical protein
VTGVAKSRFRTATHTVSVVRGNSARALRLAATHLRARLSRQPSVAKREQLNALRWQTINPETQTRRHYPVHGGAAPTSIRADIPRGTRPPQLCTEELWDHCG